MSFRTRLTIALLSATLVPVVALALVLRADMQDRLTTQYEQRVSAVVTAIVATLNDTRREASQDLQSIQASITSDNQFRAGLEGGSAASRRYIVDYAERSIELTGLSSLLILDDRDRILSSGHFRNEYDRIDPGLQNLIVGAGDDFALVEMRTADSVITYLATSRRFSIGDNKLVLVGGVSIDDLIFGLQRNNPDVAVILSPGDSKSDLQIASASASTRTSRGIQLPYIGVARDSISSATLYISHPTTELSKLKRSVDRLVIVVGSVGVFVSILLAGWLGGIMSKPIAHLSDKTKRVNLDNLNVNFHSSRSDEIGDLSRTLSLMTTRLRKNRRDIVDAERRATIGDISRQINHDIKNGLTPIRNIVKHFDETANTVGGDLVSVFKDRRDSLFSSIEYLRQLAANYSKLSVPSADESVELVGLLNTVIEDMSHSGHSAFKVSSSQQSVYVVATRLALRRIFENIIGNAVDASPSPDSAIVVSVTVEGNNVIIVVEDKGVGISPENQAHIFDDFYTTKPDGTGLGLSVVRRLVMDLHGSIRLERSSGDGSRFVVTLPVNKEGSDST